ncbi:MAG: preprotein translocase subunit SecA, partial [Thiotrichales bacterium]|nr:preprotein translocase subunit SecA [Thiotrichales bacterium]
VVNQIISHFVAPNSMAEQWNIPGLEEAIQKEFELEFPVAQWLQEDDHLHEETLREKVLDEMLQVYAEKEEMAGSDTVRHFEKAVMLQVLDHQWKEHLQAMDHLRQGIHLRGYAQKNPKQEYKRESFEMFSSMLDRIKSDALGVITRVQVRTEEDVEAVEEQRRQSSEMQFQHAPAGTLTDEPAAAEKQPEEEHEPFVRDGRKVGRNEPCPCGSGKKYKQCCGKLN